MRYKVLVEVYFASFLFFFFFFQICSFYSLSVEEEVRIYLTLQALVSDMKSAFSHLFLLIWSAYNERVMSLAIYTSDHLM